MNEERFNEIVEDIRLACDYNAGMVDFYTDALSKDNLLRSTRRGHERSRDHFQREQWRLSTALDVIEEYFREETDNDIDA